MSSARSKTFQRRGTWKGVRCFLRRKRQDYLLIICVRRGNQKAEITEIENLITVHIKLKCSLQSRRFLRNERLFNDRLIVLFLGIIFASPQPSVSFIIQDGGISDYSSLAQDIHRSPTKIRLLCRLIKVLHSTLHHWHVATVSMVTTPFASLFKFFFLLKNEALWTKATRIVACRGRHFWAMALPGPNVTPFITINYFTLWSLHYRAGKGCNLLKPFSNTPLPVQCSSCS